MVVLVDEKKWRAGQWAHWLGRALQCPHVLLLHALACHSQATLGHCARIGAHRRDRVVPVARSESTISRAAACKSTRWRPAKSSTVNAVLTQRMLIDP